MSVIVHGVPGQSLQQVGAAQYGKAAARCGGFFERVTAAVLEDVLAAAPGAFHLFHDLGGFRKVEGHGYGPISPGINIDHLVLTGGGYAIVNAKGCGAGVLAVAPGNIGILVKPDGTERRQPWLDSRADYAAAGVVIRLTGLLGIVAFVAPRETTVHPSIVNARALTGGCLIMNTADLRAGELLARLQPEVAPGSPAAPEHVAALRRYLTAPEVPARAGAISELASEPTAPVYPWE